MMKPTRFLSLVPIFALAACSYDGPRTQVGALSIPGEPKRSDVGPGRAPPQAQFAAAARRSAFSARLVETAESEWRRWGSQYRGGRGAGPTERTRGYRERIVQFWKVGTGRDLDNPGVGWSGAFVSWAMKSAGAGNAWPATGSHAHYLKVATDARFRNAEQAPFVAWRITEYAPRVGDLVCNSLERGIDYDRQPNRNFVSHCDIVVAVHGRSIDVIGGNLSDAVRKRTLLTDERGRLVDPQPAGVDPAVRKWIAVIQTKL